MENKGTGMDTDSSRARVDEALGQAESKEVEVVSPNEFDCYRHGIAKLLSGLLVVAGEMERWLDVRVGKAEGWQKAVVEADRTGWERIMCSVLLRKARFHLVAVLQANETCNVHSVAVQMRPVLECVGQLAFYLITPPGTVGGYMISDYIRLWVISHPWNMRKTKVSLNSTVHQSQYTSIPPWLSDYHYNRPPGVPDRHRGLAGRP